MFIAGSKVFRRPHRGRSTRVCGGRDAILSRLEHLFPADRARSVTEKTAKKLCGESRTRRSSLPFYDMLSERFGVLELPERQEDVVFSLLQSSKALVTQSFWISFFLEVQPARSTRAGLITTDGGGLRSGWGLFIMTLRITAI